jgi:hypothetical protein
MNAGLHGWTRPLSLHVSLQIRESESAEDVVVGVGAGTSWWAESVGHASVVQKRQTLPGTVMSGEMKLVDLMGGQNLVLI